MTPDDRKLLKRFEKAVRDSEFALAREGAFDREAHADIRREYRAARKAMRARLGLA